MVAQLDRRIQTSNARLANPGVSNLRDPVQEEKQEKAEKLGKEIEEMLEEVCFPYWSLLSISSLSLPNLPFPLTPLPGKH